MKLGAFSSGARLVCCVSGHEIEAFIYTLELRLPFPIRWRKNGRQWRAKRSNKTLHKN